MTVNQFKRRWRSSNEIQEVARTLRQQMTPAENLLWQHLRRKQIDSARFRRQHPIGYFVVDFYCAEHRLIVEVDGDVHIAQDDYDKARTEWLAEQGYRVIRFSNQQVHQQMSAVLEAIRSACADPVQCEEKSES
jgi:very-short-patch-repair endonuclease